MTVIDEIAAERTRQIEVEGWSPEHDDTHTHEEMAMAAAMYALPGFARNLIISINGETLLRRLWPWDWKWWKPEKRRRNLIKAAALLVAEVERLDRFEAKKNGRASLSNTC
jgi:hypothetical protein